MNQPDFKLIVHKLLTKYSQVELAALTDIAQPRISQYKAGRNKPGTHAAYTLHALYKNEFPEVEAVA